MAFTFYLYVIFEILVILPCDYNITVIVRLFFQMILKQMEILKCSFCRVRQKNTQRKLSTLVQEGEFYVIQLQKVLQRITLVQVNDIRGICSKN